MCILVAKEQVMKFGKPLIYVNKNSKNSLIQCFVIFSRLNHINRASFQTPRVFNLSWFQWGFWLVFGEEFGYTFKVLAQVFSFGNFLKTVNELWSQIKSKKRQNVKIFWDWIFRAHDSNKFGDHILIQESEKKRISIRIFYFRLEWSEWLFKFVTFGFQVFEFSILDFEIDLFIFEIIAEYCQFFENRVEFFNCNKEFFKSRNLN